MIRVYDHDAGYLLNEGILQFTHSAPCTGSDRPGPDDVVLYCRYLHNHTRSRLAGGSADYAAMRRNTNEHGADEPLALNEGLREVLKHPGGFLLLCNTWECFPMRSKRFQESLAGLLNYLGIPGDRVIVSCCDARAAPSPGHERIRTLGFDWAYIREKLHALGETAPVDAGAPSRPFIFLNRRYTHDRFLMFLHILEHGLRDRFHLSFLSRPGPSELPALHRLMACQGAFGGDTARWDASIRRGMEELPVVLDGPREEVDWGGAAAIAETARDARFFLVHETMPFADESLFVSEKTYKPIRLGMPFLVFGPRGILAHLRALGFSTFGPLVDEGYDDEEDPLRRLGKVMAEVERLCRLDDREVRRLHEGLMAALEHNVGHIRRPGRIPGLEQALERAACLTTARTKAVCG